jgi:hypothetical protein
MGENSEKFTFLHIPEPLPLALLSPYAQTLAGITNTAAINMIFFNFIIVPLVWLLSEVTSYC